MPVPDVPAPPPDRWRLLRPLGRALAENWRAALALQGSIALIVAAYAWWPPARAALEQVAEWKTRWGFGFAIVSTMLFAAALPCLVQACGPRALRPPPRVVAFLLLFWAWKGVEVDLLYRLQAMWFGETADAATIAAKVLVDQAVYGPLWASPSLALAYAFCDARLDAGVARARLGRRWYRDRVLTVQVSSWVVWVPTVAAIYAMPSALQLPVCNVMMCLWSLILAVLARPAAPRPAEDTEPRAAA